ncbi:hypothetical protein WOLCODRAFT_140923 [Wolfiporia cocos MD-104 SS10]|uniref:F-box domain-containing protein n=1 Tax=Wolfiporia cocos (strain MD-104) TaxID=742152 RepID=A0A2H3JCM2_WOLCO|nr:hypothetical protein WOLCODRAFT_140923 [Wolfiporia cocos MD-104 SS10]
MCLAYVPAELLLDILFLALHEHPRPSDVLCVDKSFRDLGTRAMHTHLRFRTMRQLILFSEQRTPLVCPPKTLVVLLSGGTPAFDVFLHLAAALRRCKRVAPSSSTSPTLSEHSLYHTASEPLDLDLLSLCLHSHARNPNLQHIHDALVLANPRNFMWTGPDPSHHFSTAIVPAATYHLFRAIRKWTNIVHITLTNLSFFSDEGNWHTPLKLWHNTPLLPVIPSLRTLCLGQATLLPPSIIAAMVCQPGQNHLELVRLVDTYSESIWGKRIRRQDIERAAAALSSCPENQDSAVAKVRRVVQCVKKTERIMGGDRVEGPSEILD